MLSVVPSRNLGTYGFSLRKWPPDERAGEVIHLHGVLEAHALCLGRAGGESGPWGARATHTYVPPAPQVKQVLGGK